MHAAELVLQPITPAVAAHPAVRSSPLLAEICASTLALYGEGEPPLPWSGYLAHRDDVVVGTCAFKGPPVLGSVEIAYFTLPGHEGQGVATAMASRLVGLAHAHGVRRITAQTLPAAGASTRVLLKLGFTLSRLVEHPEDGTVWEWCR